MAHTTSVDPASRTASGWAARHAALKSRAVPDDDPRVIECREALAYHRVRRSISAEVGRLSRAGADRLAADLREAVAR